MRLQPRRRSKQIVGAASGGTSRIGGPDTGRLLCVIRYTERLGPWSISTRGIGRRSATPPCSTLPTTFDAAAASRAGGETIFLVPPKTDPEGNLAAPGGLTQHPRTRKHPASTSNSDSR